jgi:hypothetical protein
MQTDDGGEIAHRWNRAAKRQEWFVGDKWVAEGGATLQEQTQQRQITVVNAGTGGGGTNDHEQLIDLLGGYPIPGQHYHFTQYHHQELGRFAQWPGFTDQFMQAGYLQQLTVEKAATGADTTLVWVKNPSIAYTALAAEVIEADASNAVLALVQFGSHYTSAPEFTNYSAVYSGSLSSALMLGALGPAANIEFWLYDSGYAGDHWRHILDVQRGGVIPAAQDTYTLGLSSNRWSDVQTKALHVNGYALTMTGAAALNQNLLTTSSPTFVGLTARNVDLTGWNPTGDGLHLGYVGGATGSGIVSYKYSSVAAYLALTCDALAHYWDLSGTLKMTLDTSGLTLATALARGANAITGSGDLGATGTYIGNAYVTRHYLNSTAYLDGATAGAVVAFASILKTYYASGDARFIISPDGAQGRRSVLSLYANFTGTGDNVARRAADIVGGYVGAWTGEYIGFEVGGSDNSFIETTERMRLTSAGLSLSSGVAFVGEYQTQTGAWAAPSGGTNGRIVTVYNSTQAASRLYVYSNGGWHYSALT